jgi:hypothetical protein
MPASSTLPSHEFARERVAAWNSGDLERVFAHYADAFDMRSLLIAERGFSPTGSRAADCSHRREAEARVASLSEKELLQSPQTVSVLASRPPSPSGKMCVGFVAAGNVRSAIDADALATQRF